MRVTFRKAVSALACLLPLWFYGCNPIEIVGTLDAQIAPGDDVVGNQSARLYINFTRLTPTKTAEGNLKLEFTDPDTNVMTIVLAPQSGEFPVGQYQITGSNANAFTAVLLQNKGDPATARQLSVTSNLGIIQLQALNTTSSGVSAIQGQFQVNFTGGGAGTGIFRWTAPSAS